MKVSLTEAKNKIMKILASTGVDSKTVNLLADMLLELDLHKNRFSGLSDIVDVYAQLKNSISTKEKIVVDSPSIKLIDGKGKSAWILGIKATDLVIKMAKTQGIAIVGIFNSTYHGILGTYVRRIAKNNLIGIVSANGGPQGVVPYGGRQGIMGTNPLAYAIPSNGLPIVFDAATAKFAYGSIRIAKSLKRVLPENSYLDKNGNFTTDPEKAENIVPFGEYKGFAINLLLEIMTGHFVRAKSGLAVKNEKDLGSFFVALDPKMFVPIKRFKKEVTRLVSEIEAVRPMSGYDQIRIPGFRGEKVKQEIIKTGYFEVDDYIWRRFEHFYNKVCHKK